MSCVDICETVQRIAAFADQFSEDGSLVPEEGAEAARHDWWPALKFWLGCSFMRHRRYKASLRSMGQAVQALADVLGDGNRPGADSLKEAAKSGQLDWRENSDTAKPILAGLVKQDVNNSRDRQMVAESLVFISNLSDLNIVAWAICEIEHHRLADAHEELIDKIRWVGPKIASLFLREVVNVYGLGAHCEETDYPYLFPVDTWVERVCVKFVIKACLECQVSPLSFNQGAWVLGSKQGDAGIDHFLQDLQ